MRRQAYLCRKRNDLAWYAAGLLVVQLGLGVCIDQFWPSVRDSDFADVQQIVAARCREYPGRRLILAIGSSRTRMGLNAGQLNEDRDRHGPLIINCGVDWAGPVLSKVALERFMQDGIRPELVMLEVMPMSLSAGRGAHNEELWKLPLRLSAQEAARAWRYFDQPHRLLLNWSVSRLFPCYRHQAELHNALGLDLPSVDAPGSARDPFGWCPAKFDLPPDKIAKQTQSALATYSTPLTQAAISPGATQAYHGLLRLCRSEGIPVVLVIPPESSLFRDLSPDAGASHRDAVRMLADEFALPLVDAQDWIKDDGFFDGHHLTETGARQYTQLLGTALSTASLPGKRFISFTHPHRLCNETPRKAIVSFQGLGFRFRQRGGFRGCAATKPPRQHGDNR